MGSNHSFQSIWIHDLVSIQIRYDLRFDCESFFFFFAKASDLRFTSVCPLLPAGKITLLTIELYVWGLPASTSEEVKIFTATLKKDNFVACGNEEEEIFEEFILGSVLQSYEDYEKWGSVSWLDVAEHYVEIRRHDVIFSLRLYRPLPLEFRIILFIGEKSWKELEERRGCHQWTRNWRRISSEMSNNPPLRAKKTFGLFHLRIAGAADVSLFRCPLTSIPLRIGSPLRPPENNMTRDAVAALRFPCGKCRRRRRRQNRTEHAARGIILPKKFSPSKAYVEKSDVPSISSAPSRIWCFNV